MWADVAVAGSVVALVIVCSALGYWLALAVASIRPAPPVDMPLQPSHCFVIAVPAHNEQSVIGDTVRCLRSLDYPPGMFTVHVVADHCDDETAFVAGCAGGTVHERQNGGRTGKGAALSWLFARILGAGTDAVVIFDADTQVDRDFLRVMDARLRQGDDVVQGRHEISNPQGGWFPALTRSMFLIDNRYQNLGRCNLNWSAKHMGDSICFRTSVLRKLGWGEGLTDDFHLRQCLLLSGVRIGYEPAAIGRGEAPVTWKRAWVQRARWLEGNRIASRQLGWRLIKESLRRRDGGLLDGALQAYCPSYSTLTAISVASLVGQYLINILIGPTFDSWLIGAWLTVTSILVVYPFGALVLEGTPLRGHLAILLGPVFIAWRACLALSIRFRPPGSIWMRTIHGEPAEDV